MSDKFRPFSNGTETEMWLEDNCLQCSRLNYPMDGDDDYSHACGLNEALIMGVDTNSRGEIDRCIAETIGTCRPDIYDGKIECLDKCKYFHQSEVTNENGSD
jgi:hypothetical protein